ncbi:ubiquinol-cytochrome c reductase core subunit 1 [Clydaea vesicula]|uniref:Cytochrome b-c1 complex subunit 2, mitochondrial n=1 Tax=Clydaea vesicula TaxID=447962 RepID=A0AAD5U803_9FUNG|nr:ubiquinol-cytochrome c reductase core subunit 1 [Clydaea vesicula]
MVSYSKTALFIILVSTHDDLGPISTLAFVINAGSRNEELEYPGVAHFVKNTLNIKGDNIVRTIREAELRGNSFYTSHSRESITVATDFLRDDLVDAVPLLVNNIFNRSLEPYEFLDARRLVAEESKAALNEPSVFLADSLHRVAFRTGLGNSLFASTETLNDLKRSHINNFTSKFFTPNRIAVIGSGVNQKDLISLLETAFKNSMLGSNSNFLQQRSKYYGGEERYSSGHSEAHYALAFPSTSFNSNEYPTALVLRALLDGSRRSPWGIVNGSSSLLANAASSSCSVVAFNTSYSDAGLLGFYIKGNEGDVKNVVQNSLNALKSVASGVGFSDASITRAVKTAIVDLECSATRESRVRDIAENILSSGSNLKTGVLSDALSKVTAEKLASFAKTMINNKPSVVAYGKYPFLPYLEDFKL